MSPPRMRGSTHRWGDDPEEHNIHTLAELLAMLTSAGKDDREKAKIEVRKLTRDGTAILATERDASNLADFANRHEP